MKQVKIGLLSVLSSVVFAQSVTEMQHREQVWYVGAQALFLQPRYSGYNQFGTLGNTPLGVAPTQLAFKAVDDTYGWGFKIEGDYDFREFRDVNLNWSHYNSTTNHGAIVVPQGNSFTDSLGNTYPSGTITTSRRPTWDTVNVEFGQTMHVGKDDDIRLHGGVQYARIKTLVTLYEPSTIEPPTNVTQILTYSGFGPRLGIDMGYHVYPAFVIYANGATGLLIGPNQFDDTGNGPHNTLQSVHGSTTGIVPELEAKLGIKYTYTVQTYGDFCFNLGWMWNNYFSSQVNNHGTDTHESDFGLQGLLMGMIWKMH